MTKADRYIIAQFMILVLRILIAGFRMKIENVNIDAKIEDIKAWTEDNLDAELLSWGK